MNNPYWQEDIVAPSDTGKVLDLSFSISCRQLPVDHAWALSQALQGLLPWWSSEPFVGLHLIHGAGSGNGWTRPEGDALFYLTKRARLVLRLPHSRVEETRLVLQGKKLEIMGFLIEIGEATNRPFLAHPALYAHRVVAEPKDSEQIFLEKSVLELQKHGVSFKKLLAGREGILKTPEGDCMTRSLLVADIPLPDSLKLQQHGLGTRHTLGCGVFVPYKTP